MAFTLIELLIIVGAILLVAACMAPMYLHAKAESARAKCADNLRAISGALLQYSAANDDTLPMACYPKGSKPSDFGTKPTFDSDARTWADLMRAYVRQGSKYGCPADGGGPKTDSRWILSYALNAYFYVQPGGVRRQEFSGGGLTEVPDIRAKLLIAESTTGIGYELAMPDSLPPAVWRRHFEGVNWIFGDGHSEFHRPPRLWVKGRKEVWENPDKAAGQNYPQWFPWIAGKPRWN